MQLNATNDGIAIVFEYLTTAALPSFWVSLSLPRTNNKNYNGCIPSMLSRTTWWQTNCEVQSWMVGFRRWC